MKNKIIFYVPTLFGGGAERVFVNLANHFVSKGIEVWFMTSYQGEYSELLDTKVNLRFLLKYRFFKNRHLNMIHRVSISMIKILFYLIYLRPNYLFCTLDEANLIGIIANFLTFNKSKFVIREANIILEEDFGNTSKKLIRIAFSNSSLIIANSPDTANSIRKLSRKKKMDITVIGNPVFSSEMSESSVDNTDLYFKNDEKYILAVGRLEPQKDYHTLLNAFKIVKNKSDLHLVILGKGSLEIELKNLAKKLGITDKIHFLGFQKNPYSFYLNAEVFVLSSIFEGFGNVLVEALALGTPIVSTKCLGGPSFILENGKYGTLVQVQNPDIMAEAILNIYNGKVVYKKQDLISRAQEFSKSNIGDKYLQAIYGK